MVAEPWRMLDGGGLVIGDTITFGITTTTITNITKLETVSTKDSVTWTAPQPVFWGSTNQPDIGALPFNATQLIGATIYKNGINYTVLPNGSCRMVIPYINGIPQSEILSCHILLLQLG